MEELQKKLNEANIKLCSKMTLEENAFTDKLNDKLYNFLKYLETKNTLYLKNEMEKIKARDKLTIKDVKENIEPNNSSLPKRFTRQRNIPDSDNMSTLQVNIKKEKISIIPVNSKASVIQNTPDINITKGGASASNAQFEEMPAPTVIPPRRKKIKEEVVEPIKRTTRSKARAKNLYGSEPQSQIDKGKTSDVLIQNTTITVIDMTDDKESDNENKKNKGVGDSTVVNEIKRSTRTKTRQQKKRIVEDRSSEDEAEKIRQQKEQNVGNRISEDESEKSEQLPVKTNKIIKKVENKKNKPKRSQSPFSSDKDENKSGITDYEDAVSNLDCNEIQSMEAQNLIDAAPVLNSTMVLENPKMVKINDHKQEVIEKKWKTPPKTKSKKEQIKEIFSPFEKTSLKTKVEAFEKFDSASKQKSSSRIPRKETLTGEPVKMKSQTPFSSKFLPKSCSTSSKLKVVTPLSKNISVNNESCLSIKAMSALKASQAEYRDREKKKLEKEREALMKKEALLQAQAEEKRRKREEKQLKAQQQRDILQREKEKQFEVQKLKEDKFKQALAEKEEKLQKSREEAEKKRLLAKQKAKLVKESQESENREKTTERTTTKRPLYQTLPIYMVTKTPPLPTDDCYDSDDESYRKERYIKPDWCRGEALHRQLNAQLAAGEKIKHTFFCSKSSSADLTEIFETIDPKKLKRTSSAIWKKPPRYTLFSMTSDIQFSDYSEEDN